MNISHRPARSSRFIIGNSEIIQADANGVILGVLHKVKIIDNAGAFVLAVRLLALIHLLPLTVLLDISQGDAQI